MDTAGTLFAGAVVLTIFMPSLDLFTAALLLAAIAALDYENVVRARLPDLTNGSDDPPLP